MAKYKRWTSRVPTQEELLTQFAAAIQREINRYRDSFSLSKEDCEDLRQDIIAKMLTIPPDKQRGSDYVIQCIRNAAINSLARITGWRPNGDKSKTQRTVYLEECKDEDSLAGLIERVTCILPNPDLQIVLDRVRERLDVPALGVFDWVLEDEEHWSVINLGRQCRKLGMDTLETLKIRWQIVDAMHDEGLCLNYPSPDMNRRQWHAKHMFDKEKQ